MTVDNEAQLERRRKRRELRDAGGGDDSAKQIELLRTKLFTIQEALIRSGVVDLSELNGPLSSISPLETRLVEGADVTLVVFAGMATRVSMPAAEFFGIFSKRADAINIVYAKDFMQCWYQRGLLGLSHDVPSTATYLKTFLARSKRIVTLGTSSGGFAAILFGVLMGAERVIAFGPQTQLDRRVYKRFKSTDSRLRDMEADPQYMDLRTVLENHPYDGRIEVHYAADSDTDKPAADHIASFPAVKLFGYESGEHAIARVLRDNGTLSGILDSIGD
jgi:hypothetical protein